MSVANNLIGKTLSNRYEILRPLGEGGMGKVYLAKDKRFGKQVVVKVPTMEAGDKDFKDRFMREIASLATLEHLHIVTTVDWGEIEGIPFLVLRYLGGGNLRDRITDAQGFYKPMPLEGLNQWLPQIASALDFIHTKNWVHRDLKPDNILFDEAGNPYLADFGIAKALEGAPMGVKTTMGAFIGTPQYMAPEMHLGKSIGPRADQFGLAVLVYEALAGKIPFAGATPTAIFVEVMQGKAKPIHELVPGIPLEKSNALMKGITKEPRDRYGSCVEFANAITGSMLARGLSSAGSETPSRVVIPGTRMETPKKPDILGTRIETPSKPEILGIKNETPTKPIIAGTRLETPSKPEIAGTRLETPKKLDVPGTRIETPSKPTIASTRMEIPSKPEIAGTMPEKLGSKPVIAGTRLERSGVKSPVVKEEEIKEELPAERKREKKRKKKGNNFAVLIGTIITGGAALFGIIFVSISMMRPKVSSTLKSTVDTIVKDSNVPEINTTAEIASIEKEMVLVPAGKFKMGDPGKDNEVTLTKPYYMGKYEVAQDQWEAVMGDNPSLIKGAKLPVTNASWENCQEFIKKLNAKTSGGYRLPTEVEWEYACRAGTTTAYSFGNAITPKDANYADSKIFKPVAVGSYKPNAFGLFDMHGNVWEWCEDRYGGYPKGAVTDPKEPTTGEHRVLRRGGSFGCSASIAHSSNRDFSTPTNRSDYNGFRLARTADIKAVASPTVPKPDPAVILPATGNLLVAPFSEAKAKEEQKAVAKSLQKEVEEVEDLGKGIKLEMVLIPSGKFVMGSPASEATRSNNAETQHEVTLTKPFYMGKYEVTQEQWEGVMGNNPSNLKGGKLPVTHVSWEDCQEFIKKLNAKTSGGYRLPTEAEWEYACRVGTSSAYSFGDSPTTSDANYGDGVAGRIKAVGSYKANGFSLYDMHGNVWEWCEDWVADYPVGAVTDPKGPTMGNRRVLRGGSFFDSVSLARSSNRSHLTPNYGNVYGLGFRLARTP